MEFFETLPSWIPFLILIVVVGAVECAMWLKMKQDAHLKDEFVHIVAHRLRSPLAKIRWSNSMITSAKDPSSLSEVAEIIKTASDGMVELIDSLISLSDAEGSYLYRTKVVPLAELVEQEAAAVKPHFEKKQVRLDLDLVSRANVNVDPQKIAFVIQTLLNNALSYTPQGGNVKVSIKEDPCNLILSVSDTGIGISAQDLPMIFTKCFRTQKAKAVDGEGMGIGLHVSRIIVGRSRGNINVFSQGEKLGTTFTVKLPVKK